MRFQCTIVFAAAIIVTATDVSAAIYVKPIQTGDVPIKRLLRLETSMGVEGEERGWFWNMLSCFLTKASHTDASHTDTSLTSLKNDLNTKANGQDLHEFVESDYFKFGFVSKLAQHQRYHEKVSVISLIRGQYGDESIMTASDNHQNCEFLKPLLFDEWIKEEKHLDDVAKLDLHKGKEWARQYEIEVRTKINKFTEDLKQFHTEKTTLIKLKTEIVTTQATHSHLTALYRTYSDSITQVDTNILNIQTEIAQTEEKQKRLQALITPRRDTNPTPRKK